MKKLEDLFCVEEMTPNWKLALTLGKSDIFSDDVIVNHYVKNGICVINSASSTNSNFTPSVLKHLRKLIISHAKVILSSSVANISEHLQEKYGLKYIQSQQIYTKGL